MVGSANRGWDWEAPAWQPQPPTPQTQQDPNATRPGRQPSTAPRVWERVHALRQARPARRRGRRVSLVVAVLAVFATVLGVAAPASADPDGSGENTLVTKLEEVARAYYDTQAVLAASQQRQAEIKQKLAVANVELSRLTDQIGQVASARYKGSSVGLINGLLTKQAEPSELLAGAAVGEFLLWRDDTYIHEYRQVKDDAQGQQALLDQEVDLQTKQRDLLDQQKRDAEKALIAAGGMVSEGFPGVSAGNVQPAPRNSAGGFSREACNQNDPTTRGCITLRTYHMFNEARLNGFSRFTSCYRSSTWGEHPLGRACDFSVSTSGDFVDQVASGDAKNYGSRLAAWGVANANALGILYVIWFRQIWTPSAGWHYYSGVSGDPASDHTNHVHISMY